MQTLDWLRVFDLAMHILMKDDKSHNQWIRRKIGDIDDPLSKFKQLTKYLKSTNYVMGSEFLGTDTYVPL